MKRVEPKLYTRKYYFSSETSNTSYVENHKIYFDRRMENILKKIPFDKGQKVLDIGCGRGEVALYFAENEASRVVGIDYSKAAIKIANENLKKASIKIKNICSFQQMDAKNLTFQAKYFDLIIMTEFLEHIYPEEQEVVFRNAFRVLKDDGIVFFHTAPSKTFIDYTYKYWCFPIGRLLVKLNNLILKKNYPELQKPEKLRTHYQKIMHVNEPEYFSLKELIKKSNFSGAIKSSNVTIAKPELGWKDRLFNMIVYLKPISNHFPLNVYWGNDFYAVLMKSLSKI